MRVEWALNDAYGPSVGTPRWIRDLASPSPDTRERACRDLGCTIYHQGTIYAASVAAVPFLLEIIASEEVVDRTSAEVFGNDGRVAFSSCFRQDVFNHISFQTSGGTIRLHSLQVHELKSAWVKSEGGDQTK